jgi:hypothetical protein
MCLEVWFAAHGGFRRKSGRDRKFQFGTWGYRGLMGSLDTMFLRTKLMLSALVRLPVRLRRRQPLA